MAVRRIRRRKFLETTAGGIGAVALGAMASFPARAASSRPNIVWLISEDNDPYLGCYGDPLARTPAIDGLAAQGVRWTNSHSCAPVCAPSRFSLITGMYATGFGPAHHMRALATVPTWLKGFPQQMRAAGYYCTNNDKTDYNATIDVTRTWNESGPNAHWRNRPPGAPFFSVFTLMATHEGAVIPGDRQYRAGAVQTDPGAVRLPAYHPQTATMRFDRARYYDAIARMDADVALLLGQLEADGLAGNTIVFYYSDNGGVLPRSKRLCYDSGLSTPLIVRFPQPSARLAPAAPGSTISAPVSSVDFAPTVLRLAGLTPPSYMQGRAFAGPDPSPRTYAFSHRDRMDERYDMQRSVRDQDWRYIRNYHPHLTYSQHIDYAWRQPGYREWERLFRAGQLNATQSAFWGTKPTEELYRPADDPDEIVNRAADPDSQAVLQRMRLALDDHLRAVNDNGFIPEGEPMQGYAQSRVAGAYPLTTVLTVAGVAIQRDPANLPRLVTWLKHGNAVVRYWAALGCLMLGPAASGAQARLITRLNDSSPAVKGAAAHALCRAGRADRGLPVLRDQLAGATKVEVRLRAVNALDELGEQARPVLSTLEQARADKDVNVRRAATHTVAVLRGTYSP